MAANGPVRFVKDSVQFLRQVKTELAKVIWPQFDEFLGSTIVVLFVILIFMVYLGFVDLGFSKLTQYIFSWYSSL